MPDRSSAQVDLVIPVHNEAESITATLREFHEVTEKAGVPIRFVVCEDGSSDGTADVVAKLEGELPLQLVTSSERKGYSRAVLDGLAEAKAEYVGFMDGDGQYDPADFVTLYEHRDDADVVIGYRNPRKDHPVRKAMSGAFRLVYERLFPVRLSDPSSPFGIAKREPLQAALPASAGVLPQGFWWEFYARVEASGLSLKEMPVTHRVRAAGETQVYRPTKVPGIASVHLRGLVSLRRELRR